MSIKFGLIFVILLAISFVQSFPKLSGGNDESEQMAKLMAYMQNLDSIKASSKSKDKYDESVDGYIDMVFDVLFGEDDSSEEATDLEFGPVFDPVQFFSLLKTDVDKSYQRKCKKISGRDDTYDRIETANKELGVCLKTFVKSDEIRSAYSNLDSKEDAIALFKTVCRKRNVPIKCLDVSLEVNAQCSFPREIEVDNSIRNIIYGLLDVVCANDGDDFISMVTGQETQQCVMENLIELKTCQYKELYTIAKRFIAKLIENETFEFRMDADDCKAFDEVQSCYFSAVGNCVDPTVKNYIGSVFGVVRNETACVQSTPQVNFFR